MGSSKPTHSQRPSNPTMKTLPDMVDGQKEKKKTKRKKKKQKKKEKKLIEGEEVEGEEDEGEEDGVKK